MREGRKTFVGRVASTKMQKTIVVEVLRTRRHRLYGKVITVKRRFKAHDELACNEGDLVRIIESRPLSKEKRWQVTEVVQHGERVELPEQELPPSKTERPMPMPMSGDAEMEEEVQG